MLKELTDQQRTALVFLSCFLGQIGSANDAEDHGYRDDARRMQEESCDNIERLLQDAPFLAELFPRLEAQVKDKSLFIVEWAIIQRKIDALLTLPTAGTISDENKK